MYIKNCHTDNIIKILRTFPAYLFKLQVIIYIWMHLSQVNFCHTPKQVFHNRSSELFS